MKERLREVNDRVRRSTSVLLGFHRKNKRNSNETIFEMITAKNCPKLTKDTDIHMGRLMNLK